jgi:hypothetical protein
MIVSGRTRLRVDEAGAARWPGGGRRRGDPRSARPIPGLNDSKKLSEKKRAALARDRERALAWAVAKPASRKSTPEHPACGRCWRCSALSLRWRSAEKAR